MASRWRPSSPPARGSGSIGSGAGGTSDLEDVERKIAGATRALYLIHYAGFAGPAREMRQLADCHGLALIEDCALSLLAFQGGQPLGSLGDVGIFCLYKALPVPNGGAIVVNGGRRHVFPEPGPPPLASAASHTLALLLQNLELRGGAPGRALRRAVRRLGRGTVKAASIERVATGSLHFNPDHVALGMSPLVRRIALRQDARAIVERRRRNYGYLVGELGELAPPIIPQPAKGAAPLFYPLLVKDKAPVMAGLEARGIETIDFWRFFHPACDPSQFPEVARLRDAVVEIPCHQDLDDAAMARVAAATREVLAACEPERGPARIH